MTSVPKPLKFLAPIYNDVKKAHDAQNDKELKERYSDLVSVLGMVSCEKEETRDALEYCLTGTRRNLVTWGHEYLRCLAGQIG